VSRSLGGTLGSAVRGADCCSGVVLEVICEYLYYNDRFKEQTNVPEMELPAELSLELALAADFLECRCCGCVLGLLMFSG
jgi:hypothetical protein